MINGWIAESMILIADLSLDFLLDEPYQLYIVVEQTLPKI